MAKAEEVQAFRIHQDHFEKDKDAYKHTLKFIQEQLAAWQGKGSYPKIDGMALEEEWKRVQDFLNNAHSYLVNSMDTFKALYEANCICS